MKVSELWRKLQQVHFGGSDDEVGGGLPTWFQSGDGSPIGLVTPVQKGALYQDTTNGALYEAFDVTYDDWVSLGGSDAGTYLTRIGVTLPDGTNDSLYIFGTENGGIQIYASYAGRSGGALKLEAAATLQANDSLLDQHRSWSFNPVGSIAMPKVSANREIAFSLYADAAVPSDSAGQDGDWLMSANGHLYFKASGAWVQKV